MENITLAIMLTWITVMIFMTGYAVFVLGASGWLFVALVIFLFFLNIKIDYNDKGKDTENTFIKTEIKK